MQPGAESDVSRTFVAPANASAYDLQGQSARIRAPKMGTRSKRAFCTTTGRYGRPNGWAEILPDFSQTVECRVEDLPVAQGDSVRFVLQHSGHLAQEAVIWNPTVILNRRG